ncbi:Type III restriction enzyme, res subunit [Leptolyngbya sp. BL0902]|uniref:DEAD/DEAH box helicase family protein n=1 Tax=Leptolyngbya sp. BL0902 TaxID=1115757 RepID=UPI0018E76200|nr:DEAD/DEAH box helicase family protein [Leptolyngbya sp. BL0902]QQE67155.1 Type III restriction enzyme, res subunit [Leptolyngbya sp. BL0902]
MGYISLNLDELREQNANRSPKQPFQHQIESFAALNKTFRSNLGKTGSGILALPTGAGKTFTSVKWLMDYVIAKNIRILWLAPSFYLLDQAFAEFCHNAHGISASRHHLNIRRVSSSPHHAQASSIELTDDVIIMTIPTAISNLNTNSLDGRGKTRKTAFREYVEHYQDSEFFVVIDEAHHSPAYGCRNLLIGDEEIKPGLRRLLPKSQFLGLTATPTHNNQYIRGWLWEIFKDKVIYEAEKATLITQGILARPNYIEVPTGKKVGVDDNLYSRLTKQHKDLPESIIEILARDQDRNNLIVNAYVKNKEKYGKTIIFADRWFQCVYLKEKLQEKGIQADAIYSHIDADPDAGVGSNQRDANKNQIILQRFKTGKDEHGNDAPLDVLINVRMLTEGADVPSVRTVFLTRQTTSTILMAQMIGRALRGEKAGGESEANIVLFFDEWERLIDWAVPDGGDKVEGKPSVKGYFPLEYISIRLVEEITKHIENPGDPLPPFSTIFPVGWYQTEVVYANTDGQDDSMEGFSEFVMAYEHNKEKFDAFMNFIVNNENLDDEWAREDLVNDWGQHQIEKWAKQYFDLESDNFGNKLYADLTRLVRHIAQNQEKPSYYSFDDRGRYNLDKLARNWLSLTPYELRQELHKRFSDDGLLWKAFYKTYHRLETAAYLSISRVLDGEMPPTPLTSPVDVEDTEKFDVYQRQQIIERDGCQCLCCGIRNPKILQVDHIMPRKYGGKTVIENGQMLCRTCNSMKYKGTDEINFREVGSPLEISKGQSKLKALLDTPNQDDDSIRSLTRAINIFYHCRAVKVIDCDFDNRKSPHYYKWTIHLHEGNDPDWLSDCKDILMAGIHQKLGCAYLQGIQIFGSK